MTPLYLREAIELEFANGPLKTLPERLELAIIDFFAQRFNVIALKAERKTAGEIVSVFDELRRDAEVTF